MSRMPKVTIIGAGSVEFTKTSCRTSSRSKIEPFTVALHDIDEARLGTAGAIARYVNEATGGRATIETHLDRRAALDGTDYAINEIQVGGRDAFLIDFEIPSRVRRPADDRRHARYRRHLTRAAHPAGDDRHRQRHGGRLPQGWLLNYTNPMAMVPWAVYEGSRFDRVVGLCHSVRDTHAFLAETVGVPEHEISYQTSGFNHQAFVTRFERDDQNLYPCSTRRSTRPGGSWSARAR